MLLGGYDLRIKENNYIEIITELQKQEKAYDESQDAYETYIKHRGLRETVKKYQSELENNILTQHDKESEIKRIKKDLKKIDGQKEIETQYIEFVKLNIIKLNAWDHSFEGKIKLLKPISAQGSLESKIVLSQYIGLFQTMESIKSPVIRFPFVVDSPRGQEASSASSTDILKMISEIKSLPQIIVATVDYEKYMDTRKARIIRLNIQRKLLNKSTYSRKSSEIEALYNLLCDE